MGLVDYADEPKWQLGGKIISQMCCLMGGSFAPF